MRKPAKKSSEPFTQTATSTAATTILKNQSSAKPTAAACTTFDADAPEPFEPVAIASMTKRADLIVVGRIKQTQSPKYLQIAHGMNNPNNDVAKLSLQELRSQMLYVIEVDRVLKGDHSLAGKRLKRADANWVQNIAVNPEHGITYQNKNSWSRGIPQLNYGIIFLTKDQSVMQFVDPDHCILPAAPVPLKVATEPFKAVVNELVHVLSTPVETLSAKGGANGGEGVSGPSASYSISAGNTLMRDAVTVLAQLPTNSYANQLRQLTAEGNPELTRLWAFAGLVSKNDWTCFSTVESSFLNPSSDVRYAAEYPFNLLEAKVQTAQGLSLAATLPNTELLSLLKSKDISIRQSVSHILEIKQDPQLVETLAQVASTDSDKTVQTNCRAALRRVTNISQEFWEKEPIIALQLASRKRRVRQLDSSLWKNAEFDQKKLTENINLLLKPQVIDRSQYPDWVTRAVDHLQQESDRGNQGGLFSAVDWLSSGQQSGWSWEGSGDLTKMNRVWYTYRTVYTPASKSADQFVIRTTTFNFPIDLKDSKGPEMTQVGVLPAAKLLDVWQQDDDLILKRQPDSAVNLLKVKNIFAADGKAIKVSPAGLESSAVIGSIQAR